MPIADLLHTFRSPLLAFLVISFFIKRHHIRKYIYYEISTDSLGTSLQDDSSAYSLCLDKTYHSVVKGGGETLF